MMMMVMMMYLYIHIYIEMPIKQNRCVHIYTYIYTDVYIYIYLYIYIYTAQGSSGPSKTPTVSDQPFFAPPRVHSPFRARQPFAVRSHLQLENLVCCRRGLAYWRISALLLRAWSGFSKLSENLASSRILADVILRQPRLRHITSVVCSWGCVEGVIFVEIPTKCWTHPKSSCFDDVCSHSENQAIISF